MTIATLEVQAKGKVVTLDRYWYLKSIIKWVITKVYVIEHLLKDTDIRDQCYIRIESLRKSLAGVLLSE
jgi:hypothetical protein